MIRKLLKKMLGNEFTDNNERNAKLNFLIIGIMFLISAIMLLFLPEQIPIIHQGDQYYNVPSILGVWLVPTIALLMNLSFIKQRRLSLLNSIVFIFLAIVMTFLYCTWI